MMTTHLDKTDATAAQSPERDRTLVASDGLALYACIRWEFPAIHLVEMSESGTDATRRETAAKRGMADFVRLSVDAVSLGSWLHFRTELAPLLGRAQEEWRPVLEAQVTGVFTTKGQALREHLAKRIRAFEGGEDALQPIHPREYLNHRTRWDQAKFRYEVVGLGPIGPEPDYPKLLEMASALERLARDQGFCFTADCHIELIELAEHAFCEYLDPANYPSALMAAEAEVDPF